MKIMMFAAFSLACVVAACDGGKGAPDATDVKLELKSPPALVTSERLPAIFLLVKASAQTRR